MIAKEEKDKRETQVMVIPISHMTRTYPSFFADNLYFVKRLSFFFLFLLTNSFIYKNYDITYEITYIQPNE